MDPNATLTLLVDAILDQDTEEQTEHAEHILDWLAKGGHAPEIDRHSLAILLRAFTPAESEDD